MSTVVIVGSSIGGVRTAQSLRSEGYDGRIVLIGEEPELPYDKPPLSKALLAGATDPEAIRLLTQDAANAAGIELLVGHRALRVDVAAKSVELQSHAPVSYDTLVIATGARATLAVGRGFRRPRPAYAAGCPAPACGPCARRARRGCRRWVHRRRGGLDGAVARPGCHCC